jgi:hypothetical protein
VQVIQQRVLLRWLLKVHLLPAQSRYLRVHALIPAGTRRPWRNRNLLVPVPRPQLILLGRLAGSNQVPQRLVFLMGYPDRG